MLLHGHVPRHSFDYKHNQTFYSNVDSKMEVREYVARFLLQQHHSLILIRGYEPPSVETFELRTKIKIQNSVPNSKNGRSVTYVYVDCDNVKTMVQHNLFNG